MLEFAWPSPHVSACFGAFVPSPRCAAEERHRLAVESLTRRHNSAQAAAVAAAREEMQTQFDKELQATQDALETTHRNALNEALKQYGLALLHWRAYVLHKCSRVGGSRFLETRLLDRAHQHTREALAKKDGEINKVRPCAGRSSSFPLFIVPVHHPPDLLPVF